MTKAEALLAEVARGWKPPKQLSVSEWADQNFVLSPEYAAEAGRWTTLSFQREPLDTISDPRVWQTVIRSCTQLLKTSAIQVATAFIIDQDPGPILIIQPRDDDAKAFSKERIAPMLRDMPCLQGKVSDSKAKKSSNTIEEKWFRGGLLACTSAGSPGNLARRAIRFLFCDEEDKWVASSGSEGKPFSLALKRTATFRHRKKAIRCCSPTRIGSSIDIAYEDSDQREFEVPCPSCGVFQSMMLKFRTQVRWNDKLPTREAQAKSSLYHCEACDFGWDDTARWGAVERGHWRAKREFNGIAGFWISELYSPWKQLSEIVLDYLTKKGSPEDLMTFINTSLAENWQDKGESPEWESLVSRSDEYQSATCPNGVLFLTAGVDVQRDRLELEIVGWGRNRESWSIDYRIIEGRTSQPEVWAKLSLVLAETFPHQGGGIRLPVSRTFIDSGDGTTTNDVYTWVRTQDPQRVTAIKGNERAGAGAIPVGQPSHVDIKTDGGKDHSGLYIKIVRPSFFKAELYAFLRLRPPTDEEMAAGADYPPGFCHFPEGPNYGDEHFKQLTAEELVARKSRRTGRISMEWTQTRPRNEALDTRVYARAAAWDYGMDLAKEPNWANLERRVNAPKQEEVIPTDAPPIRASTELIAESDERWIPRRRWFS